MEDSQERGKETVPVFAAELKHRLGCNSTLRSGSDLLRVANCCRARTRVCRIHSPAARGRFSERYSPPKARQTSSGAGHATREIMVIGVADAVHEQEYVHIEQTVDIVHGVPDPFFGHFELRRCGRPGKTSIATMSRRDPRSWRNGYLQPPLVKNRPSARRCCCRVNKDVLGDGRTDAGVSASIRCPINFRQHHAGNSV